MRLRLATLSDIPELTKLIERSVAELQADDYSTNQIAGALGTVYGVDSVLVEDGTFYVLELDDGTLAACGGWSQRQTAFGSEHSPVKDDKFLDPSTDSARVRGYFTDPECARKGCATAILQASEKAAFEAGFRKLQLTATLTGVALYERHGYRETERLVLDLPNGEKLAVVRMSKTLQAT